MGGLIMTDEEFEGLCDDADNFRWEEHEPERDGDREMEEQRERQWQERDDREAALRTQAKGLKRDIPSEVPDGEF